VERAVCGSDGKAVVCHSQLHHINAVQHCALLAAAASALWQRGEPVGFGCVCRSLLALSSALMRALSLNPAPSTVCWLAVNHSACLDCLPRRPRDVRPPHTHTTLSDLTSGPYVPRAVGAQPWRAQCALWIASFITPAPAASRPLSQGHAAPARSAWGGAPWS